jgi:hypothetical protein
VSTYKEFGLSWTKGLHKGGDYGEMRKRVKGPANDEIGYQTTAGKIAGTTVLVNSINNLVELRIGSCPSEASRWGTVSW